MDRRGPPAAGRATRRGHRAVAELPAGPTGDIYAALPGSRAHGATYAAEAIAAGAVAILTDEEGRRRSSETGTPVLVLDNPRSVLGGLAAMLYAEPANALTLMAVTGTQGKTTTTRLLEGALDDGRRTRSGDRHRRHPHRRRST